MLKFENTAEIGDRIKAYDFQPIPGRDEYWVTGVVSYKGMLAGGFKGYAIKVDGCSQDQYKNDCGVFVPFEASMLEWDGRVTKISKYVGDGDEKKSLHQLPYPDQET